MIHLHLVNLINLSEAYVKLNLKVVLVSYCNTRTHRTRGVVLVAL